MKSSGKRLRSRKRTNKIINSNHYLALKGELLAKDLIMDRYTKELIDCVFAIVERSVSFKIVMAGGSARLNGYDEKIYESYKNIINHYAKVSEIFEKNKEKFENEKIKTTLLGLNAVITSRVKLMPDEKKYKSENPILAEKRIIVNKSVGFFLEAFKQSKIKFIDENKNLFIDKIKEEPLLDENSLKTMNDISKAIDDDYFEKFFKRYKESSTFCVTSLNDIEERKETSAYYELLEREHEILTSIVKIQIDVIEKELNLSSCNLEEIILIEEILLVLKEGHQILNKNIKEIKNCFFELESMPIKAYEEEYSDFVGEIKKQLLENIKVPDEEFKAFSERYLTSKNKINDLTVKILKDSLEKSFLEFNSKNIIYAIQKSVANTVIMADDMNDVFEEIIIFYERYKEKYKDCEGKEIIEGVNETIQIKVESIEENKGYFSQKIEEVLKSFSAEKLELAEEEKAEILNQAHYELCKDLGNINFQSENFENDMQGLVEFLLKKDFVIIFKNKLLKAKENYISTFEKKIISFKREYLLYEMSTFEEIITYSISKLKDFENEISDEYVTFIEDSFKKLNNILSKNNILLISPKPHEIFNGKEHEVLMAEKNENFAKGEIIKLMNSGYKENDTVLIRANVIAAK